MRVPWRVCPAFGCIHVSSCYHRDRGGLENRALGSLESLSAFWLSRRFSHSMHISHEFEEESSDSCMSIRDQLICPGSRNEILLR